MAVADGQPSFATAQGIAIVNCYCAHAGIWEFMAPEFQKVTGCASKSLMKPSKSHPEANASIC